MSPQLQKLNHIQNVLPTARPRSLCPVRLLITFAVLTIIGIAIFTTDPQSQSPMTLPWAGALAAGSFAIPTWRRRPKRACVLKITVVLALLIGTSLFAKTAAGNCNALLGISSLLLAIVPTTPFLAPASRSNGKGGAS